MKLQNVSFKTEEHICYKNSQSEGKVEKCNEVIQGKLHFLPSHV